MTFIKKEASPEDFVQAVDRAVIEFEANTLFQKIKKGDLTLRNYHGFLKMIFHQTVYAGPTFAVAGKNCRTEYPLISEYLSEHAEEEKDHWQWVLEDLKSTGYQGVLPDQEFPPFACQNYISFNVFLANELPIARLGTAALLENAGGRNGKKFAQILASQLKLEKNQLKFLFGHGDTDIKHSAQIFDVLKRSEISSKDWAWLCYAASTASILYKNMLDEVAK